MSKSKKYTGEFKVNVIKTIKDENLSYSEALKRFDIPSHSTILRWERIYLEEGEDEGRRGRTKSSDGIRKGRPKKLSNEIENDLIKENQRLRMENEYLKKLDALIRSRQK